MRRKLIVLLFAAGLALAAASPGFAFKPHDNACQGPNNQPNCPGIH